jgi:hypothetical protein
MGLSTAVLTAIHGGICELAALAEHVGHNKRAVAKAVQVLKRRGLVVVATIVERNSYRKPAQYAVTAAGAAQVLSGAPISPGQGARPRKKTVGLRERAWWELRAHGLASLKQITTTHAEGTEKAANVNLYKYLVALERAGILMRSGKNIPARQSKGRIQWLLEIDLGPKAPVWRQQAKEVYDPNAGKVYPMTQEAVQ